MTGTILENLSGKKLGILVACLLCMQFFCFLLGGLVAPVPASVQTILATICKDIPGSHNDTTVWLYSRGDDRCQSLDHFDIESDDMRMANQIVFVFQMPLPREGRQLDYSRWQQNLIGVLQTDIAFEANVLHKPHSKITIDARLAYRNKDDGPDQSWKYLASSMEERDLDCFANNATDDYLYSCNTIPLFELGSLHHDFYLLNVRLPVDSERRMNIEIGHIKDLHLSVIYQNGGFTKVWVSLKTVFLPLIVSIMAWFWQRVHLLQRKPALLEQMLLSLGCALTVLNVPLEYLTLFFDMPFMLLLSDIRQGIFYAALLSFWLIFAGEHLLIQETGEKSSLRTYWKHLSAVAIGCVSLFLFDLCERGVQLRNPFYSIWVSKIGANVALGFIILAGVSAGCYFFFLCYMIWKVFCNINLKRTSLPSMSSARRLHYEGIIYRFQFLMLATLLCAAMTVIGFIIGQVSEGRWKWDENIDLEFTSAFCTGVYGMWNIYIFALIVLYAPSHKKWPTNETTENIMSEEIEFSNLPSDSNPSEISSLTQFARKAAQD
ncbi:protein wntless isoform X2 [Anopheles nili]|uniref:protein wntless isoform X2 n=1 Tax=Anopheles nili TaxID=185578 RepID=UPI00237BD957|nr:protein wntless isoform X2 [Anopheles nili]